MQQTGLRSRLPSPGVRLSADQQEDRFRLVRGLTETSCRVFPAAFLACTLQEAIRVRVGSAGHLWRGCQHPTQEQRPSEPLPSEEDRVHNRIRLDTADKSDRSLRLKRKRAASKEGDVRMRILGRNSLGLTSQPSWRLIDVQSMHEQRNQNADRNGYA